MKSMTDTFQKTVRSLQRQSLISATVTDNVPVFTQFDGTTVPPTTSSEVGNASARNVGFNAGKISGGAGDKVLTAVMKENPSTHVVTVAVRVESDFTNFSNHNSWSTIWTGSTHQVAQSTGSVIGNNICAFYHEALGWWVVAWYAQDRSIPKERIYSMWSSDGVNWFNWDSGTDYIASFKASYGTGTTTGVSLTAAMKDMTNLGYGGQDMVLFVGTDIAPVAGSGSSADGRTVYALHHLGSNWDSTLYNWNNGRIYNLFDIAASYTTGINQINLILNGSPRIAVAGNNYPYYVFSTTWNGEVSPTNYSKLEVVFSKDSIGGSFNPYQHLSLTRGLWSGDPDTQWIMGFNYVFSDSLGVTQNYRMWSKALEWNNWQEPQLISELNSTRNDIFYDATNSRYMLYNTNFVMYSTAPVVADISNDVISYTRTDPASGNAGTLSLVVNNIDNTTGGTKWFSEGGDSTVTNTNLITNPMFSVGTSGWAGFNATISRDATLGYPSGSSMKVQMSGAGSAFFNITFTVGTTYTMQMRVKGTPGEVVYLMAKNNGTAPNSYLTGEWDLITYTFTATNATGGVEIHCDTNPSAIFWVDQVMLEANASASPYFDGSFSGGKYAWTGTANASTSTYAAKYRPRTGTNASAIKRNAIITVKEGFVTSAGNETIQVGQYYIDDLKISNTSSSFDLNIEARNILKKAKNFKVIDSLNWQSQLRFYDPFTDGYINNNWTATNIPGSAQNNVQWQNTGGNLNITPDAASALITYNSSRAIDNGVMEAKVMISTTTSSNFCGLFFRNATVDGVMTSYAVTLNTSSIGLQYLDSSLGLWTGLYSSTVSLSANTFVWLRVMFYYNQCWVYYSTDGKTYTMALSSPVAITTLSQTEGSVGLAAIPGALGTTYSFDEFKVYDLSGEQSTESVIKSIAARSGIYRTEFDATYQTGMQNQIKNASFETPYSSTNVGNFPTLAFNDSGGSSWTSPTNILASDSVYATQNQVNAGFTNRLWGQGYGFSIPTSATITGVKVEVSRKSSFVPSTNIVTNGTFETNTTGWALSGSATIARDTTTFHSGTASLKAVVTAGGGGAMYTGVNPPYTSQPVNFSAWVNIPLGVVTTLGMWNNDGNPPIATQTVTGTGAWQQITLSGVTTTTASPINIYFRTSTVAATIYIDDVFITYPSVQDYEVKLIKGNVVQQIANRADTTTQWPQTNTVATYGGDGDLWGLQLTPADVNKSNFGVAFAAHLDYVNNSTTLSVDYIKVTVYYVLPAATTTNWSVTNSNGNVSTLAADSATYGPDAGFASGKVSITNSPTSTPSDIVLANSSSVHYQNGTSYIASFMAKADKSRTVQLAIPGTLSATSFNITDQWQRFYKKYTASSTGSSTLQLNLNNGSTGSVWIDGVMVESLAVGSTQTTPSYFQKPYDDFSPIIGSGALTVADSTTYGDSLGIVGGTSSFAYTALQKTLPADFRMEFNTKLYSTASNGTVGRVVYRSNAPLGVDSGYIFEFGTSQQSGSNWYSSNWPYRRQISESTIPGLYPSYTNYLDLSTLDSSFWNQVRFDGADIVITASDGITKIARELVGFNRSNRTGQVFWNQTMNSGTFSFFIYYGYSAGSEASTTVGVYDSNYKGVYHMEQDPTGTNPVLLDSSSNGVNFNKQGTWTSGGLVAGKMGKGITFSGTNYFNVGTTLGMPTSGATIECLVYIPSASQQGMFAKVGTRSSNGYGIGVGGTTMDNAGNHLIIIYENINWYDTGYALSVGWHHISVINLGSTSNLIAYVDGVQRYSTNPGTGAIAPTATTSIGADSDGSRPVSAGIIIDEVRFSSTPRTFYIGDNASETSNSTFWTKANQEHFSYSDWELKRVDGGVVTSIGGKMQNSFLFSVSNNQSVDVVNSVVIEANGPWHIVQVNNQVIIAVYDATYLSSSSGTGYMLLGSGFSNNYIYYDNVRFPQMWQPVPALTFSPSDDGDTNIANLVNSVGGVYWVNQSSTLKARKLSLSDGIAWTFPYSSLMSNSYVVSDKEFLNHSVQYGWFQVKGEVIDFANWKALGEHRPTVSTDEKLTNYSAVQDAANLKLQDAQQYITQPDPSIMGHPGLDVYDVIALSDEEIGIVPASYRVNSIDTGFDAATNSLTQTLGIGKVTGI